jgi:chorismate dehydratase
MFKLSAMTIAMASVKDLHAAPLNWGLTRGPWQGRMEVALTSPEECARRLAAKEVAISLLPVTEYQRIPGLQVAPGISVSSFGPVKSVLLLSKVPLEEIDSVALDESSPTSAILVRLILERVYDLHPTYITSCPDIKVMLTEQDAALLIGDAAMRAQQDKLYVYDLAIEWSRFCGLPFVFAFWAFYPSPEISEILPLLVQSKMYGGRCRREIAEALSAMRGISIEAIYEYLHRNVNYELGPSHLAGLNLFYRLAHEQGLLPSIRPLEFSSDKQRG